MQLKGKQSKKKNVKKIVNKNINHSVVKHKNTNIYSNFENQGIVQTLVSKKNQRSSDFLITDKIVLHKNVKSKSNVLSAKFINEIYTHLPFDDPIFKSRIKERLWSELMFAKKNGLNFFLNTCRQFARDVLLGRNPELIYMLNYFDFINLYLKNDFLAFALTKFLFVFKTNSDFFFKLNNTNYCLILKKMHSLRLSLAAFPKYSHLSYRFFVCCNSLYFALLKMVQFVFSMFLFHMPFHPLFKKPSFTFLDPFTVYLKKFKKYNFFLKSKLRANSLLPLWQQQHVVQLIDPIHSREFETERQLIKQIDLTLSDSLIQKWNHSLFGTFFIDSNIPKQKLEFVFWDEVDQFSNNFEFSTQVYTARPHSFVQPLKSTDTFSLFDKSDFRFLPFFFFPSLVTFFGAKLPRFCKASIVSPGSLYTLDNLRMINNFVDCSAWTFLFSDHKPSKLFAIEWIPFVWSVFFGGNLVSVNFFNEIEHRTLNLLYLPYVTQNTILSSINDLFEPYITDFQKHRKLLPKAFGVSKIDTLAVFDWLDRMEPFSQSSFNDLFSSFATQDYSRYISFPLLFPNEKMSEIVSLPVVDFRQPRLRRRRLVSALFERHNSPKVFGKFMTVLIKDGLRSRAQRLIQVSLCLLKSILNCQSSRRVFLGAARQVAPQLLTTFIKRGGRNLVAFLRTKVQRLWAKGIKNIGVAVEIRRLENWQEKNYNYAWALADEIFDIMQLKYDCFSYQLVRQNIRMLTELRKSSTRRSGLILGDRNSYQRLHELRSMSSPENSFFNKKQYFVKNKKTSKKFVVNK